MAAAPGSITNPNRACTFIQSWPAFGLCLRPRLRQASPAQSSSIVLNCPVDLDVSRTPILFLDQQVIEVLRFDVTVTI